MSEDETYQLIENYLNGILDKEETNAFEQQLASNIELSNKVRLHRLANELVIENRLQSVSNILLEQKNKGNSGNNLTKIILSTTVLMLVTLLFFTWKNKSTTSKPSLSLNEEHIISDTRPNSPVSEQKVAVRNKNAAIQNQPILSQHQDTTTVKELQPQIKNELIVAETMAEEKTNTTTALPTPTVVQEKPINSPCSTIQLNAKIVTTASCREESNGSIVVREFTGGTAPYSVTIKNNQQENVPSINIPAGNYTAFLQDKKGCSTTITHIQVPEKICEKEYTFNPFMEEVLTLPSQDQHGTLIIYERSGNPYFTKETEPSETIQWNGYSKNGELNPGYFIFVLTLKDGQIIKGGITIVR